MIFDASWWFIHAAPHVSPTSHTGFLWGILHGILMVPNLIYMLINSRASIFQAPNQGVSYCLGYVLGASVFYSAVARTLLLRRL
jgi:hypothetical protein